MARIFPPGANSNMDVTSGDNPFFGEYPRPDPDFRTARGEDIRTISADGINLAIKSNSLNFQEVAEFVDSYKQLPSHTLVIQKNGRNVLKILNESIEALEEVFESYNLEYDCKTINGMMLFCSGLPGFMGSHHDDTEFDGDADKTAEYHNFISEDSKYKEKLKEKFPHFSSIICYSKENGALTKEILYTVKGLPVLLRLIIDGFAAHAVILSDSSSHATKIVNVLADKLSIIFEKHIKPHESEARFFMITADSSGLDCVEYEFDVKKYLTHPLNEMYNDDFLEVSDKIINKLQKKDTMGVVLLHGDYGSGKTSYLRYLISQLSSKKRIIYFPPDLAHKIADPAFLNFIRNYKNSVLIIEDAENVIMTRDAGGSQAVSNILNLSDGIMGDALSIQMVCTFNCDENHIDGALVRPGRLIAKYNFTSLSEDKTTNLVKKLYGNDATPDKPQMNLAEIFNMLDKPINNAKEKTEFGFIHKNAPVNKV